MFLSEDMEADYCCGGHDVRRYSGRPKAPLIRWRTQYFLGTKRVGIASTFDNFTVLPMWDFQLFLSGQNQIFGWALPSTSLLLI